MDADDELDLRKRALRKTIRARLPLPGSPEQVSASVAAQERLAGSDLARAASVVAVYRALPTECGTASLAAALEAAGKELCYPVIIPGARALAFRRAAGAFVAGSLGIEEPTGTPVPLEHIGLIVVPALAVDPAGHRLGRGRGHYDATLEHYRGPTVSLVYEQQVVAEVPHAAHDQRVAAVCTEARLFRTGP